MENLNNLKKNLLIFIQVILEIHQHSFLNITVTNQVSSITDYDNPLQFGSVFYEPAKLTSAQYKHRYNI